MNAVLRKGNPGSVGLRLGAWLALVLLGSGQSLATEPPNLKRTRIIVPDYITGVTTLSAEEVINQVMDKPNLVIVDARITDDRKHGYLENSVSLPDIETNCETLEVVIPSKSTPVMFYCNGIQCGRSVVSIKIAKSCGYNHIYWFKGGFDEWKQKGYQYSKSQ